MSRRADRIAAAAVALAVLACAWLATGPDALMGMNWDTGSDIAGIATGRVGWSTLPWASHFAIVQLYLAVAWLPQRLGASLVDGYRLANALAFAGAAAIVTAAAARLARNAVVGALCGLAFASAWGEQLLVRTLEDNVLYLPALAALLALGCRRADDWRPRDSLVAGALVAYGRLMSWQAVVYLAPALLSAVVFGGARPLGRRLRDGALVVGTFLAVTLAWLLVYWLTARGLSLDAVLRDGLLSRPEPSYFPRDAAQWLDTLSPIALCLHLGYGIAHELGPALRDSPALPALARPLGAAGLVACALFARWAWQTRAGRGRQALAYVALTLLALTVATSLYHDLMADKYKRYDYLPLLLAFVTAALAEPQVQASPNASPSPPTSPLALALALAALVVAQLAGGAHWNRAWHARQGRDGYYGRDGRSWYGWAHALRAAQPDACQFVFAEPELRAGRYNFELQAALWTQLPSHLVVGAPPDLRAWQRPLAWTSVQRARRVVQPCAWVSPSARRVLDVGLVDPRR